MKESENVIKAKAMIRKRLQIIVIYRLVLVVTILFSAFHPLAVSAQADSARPYIDIESSNFSPYPLAITNLILTGKTDKGDQAISGEFSAVLRSDLAFSGYFNLIDPKSFLNPEKDGLTPQTINFSNWINVGAEGLLKGTAKREGKSVVITLKLFDVAHSKQIWEENYTIENDTKTRDMAHAASNDIIYYFTRTRGVFDTNIAYIMKLPGREELHLMNYDGANDRVLVRNGSLNLLPSWNIEGTQILFTSYIGGGPHLYRFDLATAKVEVISQRPGLNTGACYSPDGTKIALTLSHGENSEIYLINLRNNNELIRLTNDWGIDTSASWSPDGKQIAFVSSRSGHPHIYLMNPDGSNQRRITFQGDYNQTPRWSPRGDLIAFTARDERNVFDLFTVNPVTMEIKRLTQDQGNNEDPTWSPNGRYIAFTSTRDGRKQIYIMNGDGSNQRRITDKPWDFTNPAWQPWTKKEQTSAKKKEDKVLK